MANPSDERFTKSPKELDDALLLSCMPPLQRDVVRLGIRMTVGKRGVPDAEISYGAIMKATGCGRSGAKKAVAALMANGVLLSVRPGDSKACRGTRYAVQWDYERWGAYSVDRNDIPVFLSADYCDLWHQSDLGYQGDLGHQSATPCVTGDTHPGSPKCTDLGHPSAPIRDREESKEQEPALAAPSPTSTFEQFWTASPRQEREKEARRAWTRLSDNDQILALAAVVRFAAHHRAKGTALEYVTMPHRFLAEEQFREWAAGPPATPALDEEDTTVCCSSCGKALSPEEMADESMTVLTEQQGYRHVSCAQAGQERELEHVGSAPASHDTGGER